MPDPSEPRLPPSAMLDDDMRQRIREVVRSHRGKEARLFGSAQRGDDTPDSDVDLLVTFEEGSSLFDLIRMQHALEELTGYKVDVSSMDGVLQSRRSPTRRNAILSEATLL